MRSPKEQTSRATSVSTGANPRSASDDTRASQAGKPVRARRERSGARPAVRGAIPGLELLGIGRDPSSKPAQPVSGAADSAPSAQEPATTREPSLLPEPSQSKAATPPQASQSKPSLLSETASAAPRRPERSHLPERSALPAPAFAVPKAGQPPARKSVTGKGPALRPGDPSSWKPREPAKALPQLQPRHEGGASQDWAELMPSAADVATRVRHQPSGETPDRPSPAGRGGGPRRAGPGEQPEVSSADPLSAPTPLPAPGGSQPAIPSAAAPPSEYGPNISGKWVLVRQVGQGGTGSVYLAREVSAGRLVAIKLMHSQMGRSPEARERFVREAAAVQKLTDPHTVRLHDWGETATGVPYLVMEYLAGEPLNTVTRRRGRLPERTVLGIAEQVLRSLDEAHGQGILHGDIKPGNLMFCHQFGQDFVKVLDFGISLAPIDRVAARGERQVEVMGTPRYMAPEQLRGEDPQPGSDLFSLALTLYELAAGVPAFPQAGLSELMEARWREKPIGIPESLKGSALAPVLERALALDPAARYTSAAEMLEAVLSALTACCLADCAKPKPFARERSDAKARIPQRTPSSSRGQSSPAIPALEPSPEDTPSLPRTAGCFPSLVLEEDTRPVPIHPGLIERLAAAREEQPDCPEGDSLDDEIEVVEEIEIEDEPAPSEDIALTPDHPLAALLRNRVNRRLRRRTMMTAVVCMVLSVVLALVLLLAL